MTLLEVNEISKLTDKGTVLQSISFVQNSLQNIAIAGETGSGKSTLLKIITGLVQPSSGSTFFEGTRVKGPDEKLIPGHKGIAYLSQYFELPGFLRVEQVLEYANLLSESEAEMLQEVCHIKHLLKRRTDMLSGGEKQRIAIARLLLTSPKLLMLDEPFSNLDMAHKTILKAVLKNIAKQLNITILMVSHDPLDTLSWAHEIIVMKDGKLLQQANPQTLYHQPKNEYVAELFGKYQLLPIPNSTKRLFVRPEYFTILPTMSPNENIIGKATITDILFFGSYYEVEVKLQQDISVIVKSLENNWKIGDEVSISISKDKIWEM